MAGHGMPNSGRDRVWQQAIQRLRTLPSAATSIGACCKAAAWEPAIAVSRTWPRALHLFDAAEPWTPSCSSCSALATSMSSPSWQVNAVNATRPCHWSFSLELTSTLRQRRLGDCCPELAAAVSTCCAKRWEIALEVAKSLAVDGGSVDGILMGASMHSAGLALLWSRVLALLRYCTPSSRGGVHSGFPEQRFSQRIPRSTGLCNVAITALARSAQVRQGRRLLEEMCRSGPRPDLQSFNALIGGIGLGRAETAAEA
eukprot:g30449.t1